MHHLLFFAIAERRVRHASLIQVRSQTTVASLQPGDSGLLMSCQNVVCRGVVVSRDSSKVGPLTVAELDFRFVVGERGQGLWLLAPRFGQMICSFIAWNPTVRWDPL